MSAEAEGLDVEKPIAQTVEVTTMIEIPKKPCDEMPEEVPDEMLIRILRCALGQEKRRSAGDDNEYLSCSDCPLEGKCPTCSSPTFYLVARRIAEHVSLLDEKYNDGFDEGFREGYRVGMEDAK